MYGYTRVYTARCYLFVAHIRTHTVNPRYTAQFSISNVNSSMIRTFYSRFKWRFTYSFMLPFMYEWYRQNHDGSFSGELLWMSMNGWWTRFFRLYKKCIETWLSRWRWCRFMSVLWRVSYSYNDKSIVEATKRRLSVPYFAASTKLRLWSSQKPQHECDTVSRVSYIELWLFIQQKREKKIFLFFFFLSYCVCYLFTPTHSSTSNMRISHLRLYNVSIYVVLLHSYVLHCTMHLCETIYVLVHGYTIAQYAYTRTHTHIFLYIIETHEKRQQEREIRRRREMKTRRENKRAREREWEEKRSEKNEL